MIAVLATFCQAEWRDCSKGFPVALIAVYRACMTIAPAANYRALVAAEIRAWSGRRGYTQAELAERMGVSPSWMSRRLKGSRMIDVEDLALFAKALDVQVTDLLPRLDSNQQPFDYFGSEAA